MHIIKILIATVILIAIFSASMVGEEISPLMLKEPINIVVHDTIIYSFEEFFSALKDQAQPQQLIELTEEELHLFYELIMAEFGGTSFEAQRMGASAVINRVLSEDFPNSFTGVLYQENQFSTVFDGSWGRWDVTKSVKGAVEDALTEDYIDEAVFFLNVELAIAQGYERNVNWMLNNLEVVAEKDNVTFLK